MRHYRRSLSIRCVASYVDRRSRAPIGGTTGAPNTHVVFFTVNGHPLRRALQLRTRPEDAVPLVRTGCNARVNYGQHRYVNTPTHRTHTPRHTDAPTDTPTNKQPHAYLHPSTPPTPTPTHIHKAYTYSFPPTEPICIQNHAHACIHTHTHVQVLEHI